jgi:CRISPR-associated protein Csd1
MLLEELCTYADRQLPLPPPGYKKQAIRYVVELTPSGQWLVTTDTSGPQQRGVRRGTEFSAPYLKRQGSKPKPVLLADTAWRSLGAAYDDKPMSWCNARHREFVELVEDCALQTGEPTVSAIARFLQSISSAAVGIPDQLDLGALLTFRVGDVLPFQLESVRDYWANHTGEIGDGPVLSCVVCGVQRPALRVHPLKISGIRSGNPTGTDLISANERAYESYGLRRSLIAPTCYGCAWKYGNALNDLLENPHTHLEVGTVQYIFWTAEEIGFRPGKLLTDPDNSEVRELLESPQSGKSAAIDIDDTAFYAAGLAASGTRVVVRTWLDSTVREAKVRLARYFRLQEMVSLSGGTGPPLSLRALSNATVRTRGDDLRSKGRLREVSPGDGGKPANMRTAPAPFIADAILALAFAGTPLPSSALAQATQRCRAAQGVSRERAALIKMALGSAEDWSTERTSAMSGLDVSNREPAYLCGRLLAVVDTIQQRAIQQKAGGPNATVIDKFYGSASSAPCSVFGNLVRNAQNHISKLKKSQGTRGAGMALDADLMEIMNGLRTFPPMLTLQEQAMFALGFYHQRAADRRAAHERVEARRKTEEPLDAPDGQVAH